MRRKFLCLSTMILLSIFTLTISPVEAKKKKKNEQKIKVLLVDGQSINHPHWKEWTPVLLKQLTDSELFQVDVATSPMKGESLDKFNPKFKKFDIIISIYDGDSWPMRTRRNLENFVAGGGGLIVIHAADNAFPDWKGYNEMIGLGGWGNRTEKTGPYVYVDNSGELVRDTTPGTAGHHGPPHEYVVETRLAEHPIMKGIPEKWLHAEDELYDMLRGPALNMEILATSYSSEKYEGTRHHEPILMTVTYGDGRIFHTVMGHNKTALSCTGFMTTLIRGCEWVAKKKVTFEIPDDFPKEHAIGTRTY